MRPVHRLTFRIREFETDKRGNLHAAILCKFLQEAATVHAAELGVSVESLVDSGVAWVLRRLHLNVTRWPKAGDEIIIDTWPEALDRLTTERRFDIRTGGGEIVGSATTIWLVLDLEKRRPVRIPAGIVESLSVHDLGRRPTRFPALTAPERSENEILLPVRWADLDLAGHVNNTSYVDWVLEATPDEVRDHRRLEELDIYYLSECRRGSSVVSACQAFPGTGELEIRHTVTRATDDELAACARSSWVT